MLTALVGDLDDAFAQALGVHLAEGGGRLIRAEYGTEPLGDPPAAEVVIDRLPLSSHSLRTRLRDWVLEGTLVINDPFARVRDRAAAWGVARRLELPVELPRVLAVPQKDWLGLGAESLRGLSYPLDWEGMMAALGGRARVAPVRARAGIEPIEVHDAAALVRHYDGSGTEALLLEQLRDADVRIRVWVMGARCAVWGVSADGGTRIVWEPSALTPLVQERITGSALRIARACELDFCSFDFGVAGERAFLTGPYEPLPVVDPACMDEVLCQRVLRGLVKEIEELLRRGRSGTRGRLPARWHQVVHDPSGRERS